MATHGSLVRAGVALGGSRPALSRSLQDSEQTLDLVANSVS